MTECSAYVYSVDFVFKICPKFLCCLMYTLLSLIAINSINYQQLISCLLKMQGRH